MSDDALRIVDEIRLLRIEPWEEMTREHLARQVERLVAELARRDTAGDELAAVVEHEARRARTAILSGIADRLDHAAMYYRRAARGDAPTDGQAPADDTTAPVRIPRDPNQVTAHTVQAVWDEEGPDGVADWIRDMTSPADDTAAPDEPRTVTFTLPTHQHDIDGEDRYGRWTQNPGWETPGIASGLISAWAQGVSIEDDLHEDGEVLDLEETAHKVLAAIAWHRHCARQLDAEERAAARPARGTDGNEA